MHRFRPALIASLLLLVLAPTLHAGDEPEGTESARRPLLWVLEEEGQAPVHLFGTIHIPDPRVTRLLDEVEEAFGQSEVFFAEIEMDPGAYARLQPLMLLPGAPWLDEILGEETWARLVPVMEGTGLPAAALPRFKAWVVAMMLMQKAMLPDADADAEADTDAEAEAADPAGAGTDETPAAENASEDDAGPAEPMDAVLYRNAAAQGKVTGGLETPAEQISVFDSLTQEEQIDMLVGFLDVIEERERDDEGEGADGESEGEGEGESESKADELEDAYETLVRLYREGDAEGLGAAIRAATEGESETLKRFMVRLIDDRNVRMVERLLKARTDHPQKRIFVAVGAAHYPGELGIVALLRAQGHTVRRIGAEVAVPATE